MYRQELTEAGDSREEKKFIDKSQNNQLYKSCTAWDDYENKRDNVAMSIYVYILHFPLYTNE